MSKKLFNSEFLQNIFILTKGTTIAQFIPILISPILTRIYSPEDFGILSLFVAIVSIFSAIVNLKYEQAIVVSENNESINIFFLSIIINFCISSILFIVIILFNNEITSILNNNKISMWLYFIPIVVFFTGAFNALVQYSNKQKLYKDISKSKIIKSFVLSFMQIIIGFLKNGATGLISGVIISQLFANLQLIKNININRQIFNTVSLEELKKVAIKYINFPKYNLLSTIANMMTRHILNILISLFFSISTLGFYSLIQKILGMPSALIGSSIGQVFYQKASEEKKTSGVIKNIYLITIKKVTLIGIIIFLPLYFLVDDLFILIFGNQWRIAGEYATLVTPFFLIRFIAVSVSTTFFIYNYLRLELTWQVIFFLGTISIFYIFNNNFYNFLYYFNIWGVFMYSLSIFLTYKLATSKRIFL